MEIAYCRYCQKLFHHFEGERICPRCKDVLEERFRMVKQYIYDNPKVSPQEVAQEFGVSIRTIYRWVRQERLEFSADSAFGLPCEGCDETIKVGRFCKTCKNTLGNRLNDLYKEPDEPVHLGSTKKNPKMRFLLGM